MLLLTRQNINTTSTPRQTGIIFILPLIKLIEQIKIHVLLIKLGGQDQHLKFNLQKVYLFNTHFLITNLDLQYLFLTLMLKIELCNNYFTREHC